MTIAGGSSTTMRKMLPRKQFRLTGPSLVIDPSQHVVRDDLADVELADRVFAPHYAAGLTAALRMASSIHATPSGDVIASAAADAPIEIFDTTGGWSWIRHGRDIGYVPADCVLIP